MCRKGSVSQQRVAVVLHCVHISKHLKFKKRGKKIYTRKLNKGRLNPQGGNG